MKIVSVAGLGGLCVILCGCVSVFEGTSQTINVVTNPTGATCVFEREGKPIGTVVNTPASLVVRKSKYDITIKCDKPGYQQADYLNHSGTSATIAANVAVDLILTAGISSIVDSADGADNKYDSVVNLFLIPSTEVPPAPAPVAVSPSPPTTAAIPAPSTAPQSCKAGGTQPCS
jgi:hypothetical protein